MYRALACAACRRPRSRYLRSGLAPAVSSGLSCIWTRSYRGASSRASSTTEIVMTTVLPACVLVSLHISMAGRQNGRGSSSRIAMRPSSPPKTSKGSVKPVWQHDMSDILDARRHQLSSELIHRHQLTVIGSMQMASWRPVPNILHL